jgi:hypothetical protein
MRPVSANGCVTVVSSRAWAKSLVPGYCTHLHSPTWVQPHTASSNVLANIVLEIKSIDFTKWLFRARGRGRAR